MNLAPRSQRSVWLVHLLQLPPLFFALVIFLALSAYQLHLPGLHYDEAKEAGLNAMQLVTGQPVAAFRDATVQVGPWRIPLMVQDYIGALNVLLAIPFLALGGINALALRWLSVAIGALTLLVTWRIAGRLGGAIAASITVLLLAVNPSFIFWSRQGVFVTNLTALLFMASLLTSLRWWTRRRAVDLWLTALLLGLGLYGKLSFAWAIGALAGLALIAWAAARRKRSSRGYAALETASHDTKSSTWLIAGCFFLVPLIPLLLFNLRTGGTFASLLGNLHRSYYGVDNSAYLANLLVRIGQVRVLLRGDHFWYLGELFANPWAPWLALGLIGGATLYVTMRWLVERKRRDHVTGTADRDAVVAFLPVFLLVLIVAQSAFTVSDLFITHYALLLPLIPLAAGLAAGLLLRNSYAFRPLWLLTGATLIVVAWWCGADLWTTVRYHRVLSISGGYAAHSDAIYDLALYLDQREISTPLALDWGVDAPVRFLTVGRVNPIEVFGYAGLDVPDTGFADRVESFLDDPNAVYVAHGPETAVFKGRLEAFQALAAERGLALREEAHFNERNGRTLFVVYRLEREEPAGLQ
jgi:hypothetical protein